MSSFLSPSDKTPEQLNEWLSRVQSNRREAPQGDIASDLLRSLARDLANPKSFQTSQSSASQSPAAQAHDSLAHDSLAHDSLAHDSLLSRAMQSQVDSDETVSSQVPSSISERPTWASESEFPDHTVPGSINLEGLNSRRPSDRSTGNAAKPEPGPQRTLSAFPPIQAHPPQIADHGDFEVHVGSAEVEVAPSAPPAATPPAASFVEQISVSRVDLVGGFARGPVAISVVDSPFVVRSFAQLVGRSLALKSRV